MEDEVLKRFAVPPGEDVGAKAVVGEALCWVYERVAGGLYADVEAFGFGRGGCYFVGVVLEGPVSILAQDLDTAFDIDIF